jgi:anthranilate/para-aminobenzoate synthase component II
MRIFVLGVCLGLAMASAHGAYVAQVSVKIGVMSDMNDPHADFSGAG